MKPGGATRAPGAARPSTLVPLAVLAVGLGAVAVTAVVGIVRHRLLAHELELGQEVAAVRYELLRSHLELEELAEGGGADRSKIEGGLERAEARLASLATNGESPTVPEALAVLRSVRRLSARREAGLEAGADVGVGTELERTYDRELEELLGAVDRIEAELDEHAANHRRRIDRWALGGMVGIVLVIGLASVGVWRQERQRAEAEAALERQRDHLVQVQKMEAVGRLAGGIAHDVNNYLAAIRTQADLVRRKEMPRERVIAKMGTIGETVLRASSLVERLLTFARRQPSRAEVVDCNDVVEALEGMIRGALGERCRFEMRLDPRSVPVSVDVSELEQVVTNLVMNARDAIAPDGRIVLATGRQEVATPDSRRPTEVAVLAVSDDGCGMAVEVRERIFDPFFTTKSGVGASGLGLATVFAVVDGAGGRVEVESEPGRGTTVRILLPLAAGAVVPRGAAIASDEAPRGHERILLVEDHADARHGIGDLLASLGYAVTPCATSSEALERAAAESFDLLVTDVQLPGLAGPELAGRVRSFGLLRVLYLSGYTDRISLRSGPGRGEAYFLKKPFSAEGLARMVRELLDGPESHPRSGGSGGVRDA